MLSYIHAYHAGNHGDILKHITLSLVLEHLLKKDKPFCLIDTHAASGRYSITDERILKTNESKDGIEKLIKTSNETLKALKYFQIAKTYLEKGLYPGSGEIARCIMRSKDQLFLNELHPQVINDLKRNMKLPLELSEKEVPLVNIHNRDAGDFLNSSLPPKIKRGAVIIDPSYEDSEDFSQTTEMFIKAFDKWPTGTYMIWYPLLEHRSNEISRMKQSIESFVDRKLHVEENKTLFFELEIKNPSEMTGLAKLYGSGMIVVNPPYGLSEKLESVIPVLKEELSTPDSN